MAKRIPLTHMGQGAHLNQPDHDQWPALLAKIDELAEEQVRETIDKARFRFWRKPYSWYIEYLDPGYEMLRTLSPWTLTSGTWT